MRINLNKKGHQWERDICILLQKIKGVKAKRKLEYQEGGYKDIETNLPFRIQCKCCKMPPRADLILKEMLKSKNPLEYDIYISKKTSNRNPTVSMSLEDWIDLIKEWWEVKNL